MSGYPVEVVDAAMAVVKAQDGSVAVSDDEAVQSAFEAAYSVTLGGASRKKVGAAIIVFVYTCGAWGVKFKPWSLGAVTTRLEALE